MKNALCKKINTKDIQINFKINKDFQKFCGII